MVEFVKVALGECNFLNCATLATIFTQDSEVLQVVKTLALVCMVLVIDLYVFVCICLYPH